jgi:hypothetical protein
MSDGTQAQVPASPSWAWDLFLKVAGTIAGGLTLAGFVAVVGGAVLWARFYAAGLPPDQAVSLVPNGELIVVGAATLIPFFVFAGAMVLIVYLLGPDWISAGQTHRASQKTLWAGAKVESIAITPGAWRTLIPVLVVFVLESLLAFFITSYDPAHWNLDLWPALTVGLLGTGLSYWVAQRTHGFRWFGLTVFVSIAIFGAAVSYVRSRTPAKVQPAAVLRKGDDKTGVTGFYIGQTEKRIYLASVVPDEKHPSRGIPSSGHVITIDRANVASFALGTLQGIGKALKQANTLRDDLVKSAAAPAVATKPVAKPAAKAKPARAQTRKR